MEQNFFNNTYLYASNASFFEEMYEKFCQDPSSVSEEWRIFFQSNQAEKSIASWSKPHEYIIASPQEASSDQYTTEAVPQIHHTASYNITSLRNYGHFAAKLDPLNIETPKTLAELNIDPSDPKLLLYTSSTGVEFEHISNHEEKLWLYNRFEELNSVELSSNAKLTILQDLIETAGFEQFIHKKFPGAKRFSVEGAETSIVSLKEATSAAGDFGVNTIVVGMAHRGRLNVLAKILGKPYEALLGEFMGIYAIPPSHGISGDVKYHMGYSNDIALSSGKSIHISLAANPSHLESVNPVVAGKTRATQDLEKDYERAKSITIIVHGDAAFCGQGVVAESLAMSPLDAFSVGGIFHLVINNQIGFTANPDDGHKSSRYSTEVAKIIGAPIIHVNGDDAEAVSRATRLLIEYRMRYKKDAVLEIICYRKYGHNEGDEPMYTQPLMYNIIKAKQHAGILYQNQLEKEGVSDSNKYQAFENDFASKLEKAYSGAKDYKSNLLQHQALGHSKDNVKTCVPKDLLKKLLEDLLSIPADFSINPKLRKLFDAKAKNFNKDQTIDWSTAEQLAFASLLHEGSSIRLVGQDAGRGTFSHRHSVLYDQKTGAKYIPLSQTNTDVTYEVYDSNLSEFAVLGFELGYSMSHPKSLVIWEAQFGDFSNGAQIILDQFISSMETKWLQRSGIVMLLPHGYEGQGPEHSSARLERYLQLCAQDNIQVAYPTTPANIFHLLKRQQLSTIRKPLIVMSPKSIFRNSLAVSSVEDIDTGSSFQEIIADDLDAKSIKKIVLCTGKIYYDLLEARRKSNKNDVALIRIEQLYPFPLELLNRELEKYNSKNEVIWCQEEPWNMGAWHFIYSRFAHLIKAPKLVCISREEAASPATGYASMHAKEQEEIISKALN